jgi:hypothetical protein
VVDSLFEASSQAAQIDAAIDYLKKSPYDIKNWDNVYLLLHKFHKKLLVKVHRTKTTSGFGTKVQKGWFYMWGSNGPKSSLSPLSPIPGFTTIGFHKWPAKSKPTAADIITIAASHRSMKPFIDKELLDIKAS